MRDVMKKEERFRNKQRSSGKPETVVVFVARGHTKVNMSKEGEEYL
jgi:hypothetical protein